MRNQTIAILSAVTILLLGCGKEGPQGAPGASIIGSEGGTGPQGKPGSDAPPVSFVELCSGFTPTYPNIFPEYAICQQGILWGVYSQNGGFMTQLPPGVYSSDGVNASCTFTVGSNCMVTRN